MGEWVEKSFGGHVMIGTGGGVKVGRILAFEADCWDGNDTK